jgi:hypothetical protein
MKNLFKQTKVVYDAHMKEYNVYYKNWLFWNYDQSYKVGTHLNDERAKELAITRAKDMLDTVEVYRSPSPVYYP